MCFCTSGRGMAVSVSSILEASLPVDGRLFASDSPTFASFGFFFFNKILLNLRIHFRLKFHRPLKLRSTTNRIPWYKRNNSNRKCYAGRGLHLAQSPKLVFNGFLEKLRTEFLSTVFPSSTESPNPQPTKSMSLCQPNSLLQPYH